MFFHGLKIPVFIDGAHAVGQLPIDIKQLKVDAYCSNFHKWGFSPKNAAFLYLSDEFTKVSISSFRSFAPQPLETFKALGYTNNFSGEVQEILHHIWLLRME